ncbi:MAG: AHH domain-containing protein [Gammaproteobacteria bacterium]|nr:AHH domain-containing protein [Gammaproteobacteria bacterium]
MSDDQHIVLDGEQKAELHYRSGYRQKGHAYISGCGRKDRYNRTDDIKKGLKKLRFKKVTDHAKTSHAERYYFTYKDPKTKRRGNFTHYMVPYYHQAHHLLPQDFWKKMTPEQKKILKQIKYSINNGENIIFLPSCDRGKTIHKLPLHKGFHPRYNRIVIKDAKEIKDDIQKAVKKIRRV